MERKKQELKTALDEIRGFSYPKLYEGKEWFVYFNAFNPAEGKMKRKRIKINSITKIHERRVYADNLIYRLMLKLEQGWNPWIESEDQKSYHKFCDVCEHYRKYIHKMLIDNIYREETYKSYLSYLRNIEKWNDGTKNPIVYVYQFNRGFLINFLEYIYIDKNNSARTRNNYLGFIRTFSTFLVQNQYCKIRPSDEISVISRMKIKKERTIIKEKDVIRLAEYLNEHNRYYLLACYILHYCFIRPKEMSLIRLEHISLNRKTLFISGDISKNRKSGTVTLPIKVIHLMVALNIFDSPGSYYLFSNDFRPGELQKSEKQFRDFWLRNVRKDLKFPANYKFYSLKDTGITSMLKKYDSITVRDQARHADILMTDTYTPHDLEDANDLIVGHDGVF